MDIRKRLKGAFRRVISEVEPNYEYDVDVEDIKECVEKQIPVQPFEIINGLTRISIFQCYNCLTSIDKTYNYCPCCGQRIEWNKDKWNKGE